MNSWPVHGVKANFLEGPLNQYELQQLPMSLSSSCHTAHFITQNTVASLRIQSTTRASLECCRATNSLRSGHCPIYFRIFFDYMGMYWTYKYWFYWQFPSINKFVGFPGNDCAWTNSYTRPFLSLVTRLVYHVLQALILLLLGSTVILLLFFTRNWTLPAITQTCWPLWWQQQPVSYHGDHTEEQILGNGIAHQCSHSNTQRDTPCTPHCTVKL